MHQAGSDSLLTEQVFLKVADVFFNGVENLESGKYQGKFSGQLYGYGGNQTGIYRWVWSLASMSKGARSI